LLADVIVVKGNPPFDIVALSTVDIVVKDGIVYKGGAAAETTPRSPSGVAK
jgi:imidazolonepropionase-like amidohydrolase